MGIAPRGSSRDGMMVREAMPKIVLLHCISIVPDCPHPPLSCTSAFKCFLDGYVEANVSETWVLHCLQDSSTINPQVWAESHTLARSDEARAGARLQVALLC